jgi:hypothetical protein
MARAAGLEDQFGSGFSKDRDWRSKAPAAYLVTATELHRRFPDVFIFAFVREPLSRLASCYRSKVSEARNFSGAFRSEGLTPETSFSDFVRHVARRGDWRSNVHYRAQAAILTRRGKIVPHFIGRFETLTEDWTHLNEILLARGCAALPRLPQRSQTRPIVQAADYFAGDTALAALAKERYRDDYRLFYPEQV